MAHKQIVYTSNLGDTAQEIIEASYNPFIGLDDIRREYRQFRATLQKRYKRLVAAGYGEQATARNIKRILEQRPSALADRKSAALSLAQAVDLLNAQTSTVSGMRAYESNVLKGVQAAGYHIDNTAQLRQFGKFMEKMRELGVIGVYDSGEIARAFTDRGGKARSGKNSELAWKRAVSKRLGLSWAEIMESAEG